MTDQESCVHHWIVTIEDSPSRGRVYRHRCTKCKKQKDQPVRDDSPKRWSRRALS